MRLIERNQLEVAEHLDTGEEHGCRVGAVGTGEVAVQTACTLRTIRQSIRSNTKSSGNSQARRRRSSGQCSGLARHQVHQRVQWQCYQRCCRRGSESPSHQTAWACSPASAQRYLQRANHDMRMSREANQLHACVVHDHGREGDLGVECGNLLACLKEQTISTLPVVGAEGSKSGESMD